MQPLYMTPERYRVGGFGADLTGIEPVELRAVLFRATSMANSYCNVPGHPVVHDFRGGSITGEEIAWDVGMDLRPGQRRVYPRHTPLRSLTELKIEVTENQYVAFTSNEIYRTDAYFEIVSMAYSSFGLFGAAIIPTIGLTSPVARVSYEYGDTYHVTGEMLEQTDARTYRAMNQWWHSEPEPTVYLDGVPVNVADYTIDEDEGTVTFDTTQASDAIVSVDYTHRLHPDIAEATGMIATELLGDRSLTRKGLHGLVELAVGEVRIRRDFPRAGVQRSGMSDKIQQLLDPHRFITVRGGSG